MHYFWEILKELKIYSLEKRRERYMILFRHKIMLNMYPNPGFNPEDITFDERYESICVKPKYNPRAEEWVKRIRSASFFAKGPKLYQTVLPKLGGIAQISEPSKENLDKFKEKLDEFLQTIPDEPGDGDGRVALTNSILDQIRHQHIPAPAAVHPATRERINNDNTVPVAHPRPTWRNNRARGTFDRPFVSRWDM